MQVSESMIREALLCSADSRRRYTMVFCAITYAVAVVGGVAHDLQEACGINAPSTNDPFTVEILKQSREDVIHQRYRLYS